MHVLRKLLTKIAANLMKKQTTEEKSILKNLKLLEGKLYERINKSRAQRVTKKECPSFIIRAKI